MNGLMHPAQVSDVTPKPEQEARTIVEMIGPRGVRGLLGWTFFDPVNLVCVSLLTASAALVVLSMRARGATDWYMPIGLYLCLATFLRGYIFNYYSGKAVGRAVVLLCLIFGILGSAALWEERTPAHEVLRAGGVYHVSHAEGFHLAALLHISCAISLLIHYCLPRKWLVRMTDEMVDRSGGSGDLARDREEMLTGHNQLVPEPEDGEIRDDVDTASEQADPSSSNE